MRGRVKAASPSSFLLSLFSFVFPLSSFLLSLPAQSQCSWSPRTSVPFRTTALDVSIDGSLVWLATGYGVQLLESGGTSIVDAVALPGSTRVVRADGRGVAYAGSGARVYVLQRNGRSVSVVRAVDAGAAVNDMLIVDRYLFVATANGLLHFDVVDPVTPMRTTVVPPTSAPTVTSLAMSGSRLFAADGDATVEVFSITIPRIPQRTGELAAMPRATSVHAHGEMVFVSDTFGQNTDVFAGTSRVARMPVATNAFAAAGNGVHFAAGPDRTLRAIDFTSMTTVRELFEHQLAPTGGTDNVIHAIARSGDTLYVAAGDIGLAVFDVSTLAPPYPLAAYRTGGTTSVVVSGDRAWFADASGAIGEQKIVPSGIALTPERTWNGGTIVHDVDGSVLLTSSNDTTTLWSLASQSAVATTKFRAAVAGAAIRGNDVVALLADGTVWLGGATAQQVALPPMAQLARAGDRYLFSEVRNEGRTILHAYASPDFTAQPQRVTLEGVAVGTAAFDGARAAVFTFRGVNVVDLASGSVRVIPGSTRVLPRQLTFAGDDLLLLDRRTLYVYDDARTLVREQFLAADAVMLDTQGTVAVMATSEGTLVASFLATQPSAAIPFASSFYTKVVSGGGRLYLLGADGVDIHTTTLRHVRGIRTGGLVDVAAGTEALFTLSASGVVTAYSREGVQYAQMTLNEGTDAQPLAIHVAGNAVWVSLSRGCLTGGCQKKTLVLDPSSLAITTTLNGGAIDVVTSGTRAYALFDLPAEIRVLDVTDPLRPAQVIAAAAPASAGSIAAHAGRVYVAGDRLYEYAESTLLQRAAHLAPVTPDKSQQVRVDGSCLIITGRGANPETYNAATMSAVPGSFEVPSAVRAIAVEPGRIVLLTGHSIEIWSAAAAPGTRRRALR